MNCEVLLEATLAWELQAEAVTLGYKTEMTEYEETNPRPNLKAFLLANKGMHDEPET